jgi:hypothetical protein
MRRSAVSEYASEPTLAGDGFSGDQDILSPPDPVAGCGLGKQRLVETARRLGVDINLSRDDEPSAFSLDGLAIDEEAEALLERERSNSGLPSLLLERFGSSSTVEDEFGHADEAEGDEPVVCRM